MQVVFEGVVCDGGRGMAGFAVQRGVNWGRRWRERLGAGRKAFGKDMVVGVGLRERDDGWGGWEWGNWE